MSTYRALILPLAACVAVFAADPVPQVQVVVRQLNVQQSLEYDEAGAPKRPTVRTQLDLAVTPPADWNVISIGNIEVSEWVCDDGTVMASDAERSRFGRSSMRRFSGFGGQGNLTCSLSSTQAPTGKAFAKITGSMVMQVADGAIKEAVLTPVKEMVGQAVEVEGVPGAVFEIEAWNEREIAIGFPSDLESRIQSIELRTKGGDKIESNGYSGSGGNDHYTRTMRARVPADGVVAIRLIPKLKDVTVPFALANVALPGAEQARKPVKKIQAAPVTPANEPQPESAPVKPVGGQGGAF